MPTYGGGRIDDRATGNFPENSELELLCDMGAASLLMDERWLRPLGAALPPGIEGLVHLSTEFDVSMEAMALRLTQLDIWPGAFVLWEMGFRKAERIPLGQGLLEGFDQVMPKPKPRVQRVYCSPNFPMFIPKNKSVAADSLVAHCFQTQVENHGVEAFLFGRQPMLAYCENLYAPYKSGADLVPRVISLLLPAELREARRDREPGRREDVVRLFID